MKLFENRTMPRETEFIPGVGFAAGFEPDAPGQNSCARKCHPRKLSKSLTASGLGLAITVAGMFLVCLGFFFPSPSSSSRAWSGLAIAGIVLVILGFGAMVFGCVTADHKHRTMEHQVAKGVECPCNDPSQSPFQRGYRPPDETTTDASQTKNDATVTSVSSVTSGLGPSDASSDEFGFAGGGDRTHVLQNLSGVNNLSNGDIQQHLAADVDTTDSSFYPHGDADDPRDYPAPFAINNGADIDVYGGRVYYHAQTASSLPYDSVTNHAEYSRPTSNGTHPLRDSEIRQNNNTAEESLALHPHCVKQWHELDHDLSGGDTQRGQRTTGSDDWKPLEHNACRRHCQQFRTTKIKSNGLSTSPVMIFTI